MPNENNGQGDPGENQQGGDGTSPESWETWLESQSEEVRALYEEHTSGLRSALQGERQQRSDLARQLREATAALEEGSEARTTLEQVTAELEVTERRAEFYEQATRPEIGCANVRLAYLAAQEIDAFDRRGNVNWERLKEQFPELFKQTRAPAGNAGTGTQASPGGDGGMNAIIRRATGRE